MQTQSRDQDRRVWKHQTCHRGEGWRGEHLIVGSFEVTSLTPHDTLFCHHPPSVTGVPRTAEAPTIFQARGLWGPGGDGCRLSTVRPSGNVPARESSGHRDPTRPPGPCHGPTWGNHSLSAALLSRCYGSTGLAPGAGLREGMLAPHPSAWVCIYSARRPVVGGLGRGGGGFDQGTRAGASVRTFWAIDRSAGKAGLSGNSRMKSRPSSRLLVSSGSRGTEPVKGDGRGGAVRAAERAPQRGSQSQPKGQRGPQRTHPGRGLRRDWPAPPRLPGRRCWCTPTTDTCCSLRRLPTPRGRSRAVPAGPTPSRAADPRQVPTTHRAVWADETAHVLHHPEHPQPRFPTEGQLPPHVPHGHRLRPRKRGPWPAGHSA